MTSAYLIATIIPVVAVAALTLLRRLFITREKVPTDE